MLGQSVWLLLIGLAVFCPLIVDFVDNVVAGQTNNLNNTCIAAETCGQCISIANSQCYWCDDPQFNHPYRCNGYRQLLRDYKCSESHIIGRELKTRAEPVANRAFSKEIGQIVQLRPQRYRVSLRAGEQLSIPIHFQKADDYPMDLYYLIDLSCTMRQFLTNLAEVGQLLADTIKRKTKDFKIGFGAFVDKPVKPFAAHKLETIPCCLPKNPNDCINGEPTYSFSHRLTLDSNEREFVSRVRGSRSSGNTDSPEGTLDALMQALVCKRQIGWRDQSDKIIVVATDEEFHYAGDGKLAGIVTPNDGQCHMKDNNYTHYHLLDYPSMYQIAEKVRENKFNIVFTVTNKVQPIYRTLVDIIGSNARLDTLQDTNSRAIVELIDKVYSDIRSSVELRVEPFVSTNVIDVELLSNCNKGALRRTNNCTFQGMPAITFSARIGLKECPKDRSQWNQKLKIGLANVNESVEIDLEMLCECDCERPDHAVRDSPECSNKGTFACGICVECYDNRIGKQCDCDPGRPVNPSDPEAQCKLNNITKCSGRGDCECTCQCLPGFSGDYCQYDETNCLPINGRTTRGGGGSLCSGQGKCLKGHCDCKPGFNGTYCECPTDDNECKPLTDQKDKQIKLCSGEGECRCNKCQCNNSSLTGRYCHLCPRCESQQYCDLIARCVPQVCQLYGYNCTESCQGFTWDMVVGGNTNQLTTTETNGAAAGADGSDDDDRIYSFKYQCRNRSSDNQCDLSFSYERRADDLNNNLRFLITNVDKNCIEKVNLVVVSSGVVAGVILVGLALLLIWKLITELWDRKEFARFQKELSKTKWGQSDNPLYKEVKQTYQNPMFGLRERSMKRLSRLTERISRRFDINT
ncbi:integrin beta-PS-like [Oppia nitens]|uniref:integrin beta-PS-like n=1 Tax=Oppia nitens TaxID=1686743 RepID=UPI0023DC496A|nr:integrin beta-PS-like [Oppia nitens]